VISFGVQRTTSIVQRRHSSFLPRLLKKQNFEIDSPASSGGQEKYMKYVASLGPRLRQHCLSIPLACLLKTFLRRNQ